VTYARARLLVGITGVGIWVVAAVAFLAADGPSVLPGPDATFSDQAAALAAVLGVYVLVSLPFDALGGYILPRRFGRSCPDRDAYVLGWARGVLVQAIAMALAVLAVVAAGRAGGTGAAIAVVAAIAMLIGVARMPIARMVADLGPSRVDPAHAGVVLVDATDPGFTGGVAGLGGRVMMPSSWAQALGQDLEVEVARRRAVAGAPYWLGLLLAAAWTVGGVAIAIALPGGGVQSVGQVAAVGAWFTLWSFLGLLVLPSVSRPGVMAADAAAAVAYPADRVAAVIRVLDGLQDDEPERPDVVEVVFHPIPSADRRIARLDPPCPGLRPWHAARMALPMSWCMLGLLGRAVHCNAGRPELWVLLPAD